MPDTNDPFGPLSYSPSGFLPDEGRRLTPPAPDADLKPDLPIAPSAADTPPADDRSELLGEPSSDPIPHVDRLPPVDPEPPVRLTPVDPPPALRVVPEPTLKPVSERADVVQELVERLEEPDGGVRPSRAAAVTQLDPTDDRELHGGSLTGDRVRLGNPTAAPAPPLGTGSRVIAFASAKGGVGKTTLAVVTSTYIAQHWPDLSVALVDCEPDFGMLVPALSISLDSPNLGAALHGTPVLDIGVRIDSGVTVYGAPTSSDDQHALLSRPEKLRAIIDQIAALHDLVLIDLGAGLAGALNATLLHGVHGLVLVSEPRYQTTHALMMAVERLNSQGLLRDRALTLVINRDTEEPGRNVHQRTQRITQALANRDLLPLIIPDDEHLADALDDGAWTLASTSPTTTSAVEALVRSLMHSIGIA